MRELIKNELSGWKAWEVVWLGLACLIITMLSIYWGDNLMGIVSATTGVACVVLTGKGKLSAYLFGLVNCVLYAIIAYKAAYYGETTLNLLYYSPMQFYGFYVWKKNMNIETNEVKKRFMNNKTRLFSVLSIIAGTIIYGFVLKCIGDAMPFVDSFTTISSVVAMVVSIKMFAEQWWIWIFVNMFSVYMWITSYSTTGESFGTLIMWIVYLGNSIIMCYKWTKEAKENEEV